MRALLGAFARFFGFAKPCPCKAIAEEIEAISVLIPVLRALGSEADVYALLQEREELREIVRRHMAGEVTTAALKDFDRTRSRKVWVAR